MSFDDKFNVDKFLIVFAPLAIRVMAIIWSVNIAQRQNRNHFLWGWFTFFFPSISLIIIGQLRKLKLTININEYTPINEQIAIIYQKAVRLYLLKSYSDSIQVLNYILTLDKNHYDSKKLIAQSYFMLNDFVKAKNCFEELLSMGKFLSDSSYYLGLIKLKENNIERALDLFKLAKQNGNEGASFYINKYGSSMKN